MKKLVTTISILLIVTSVLAQTTTVERVIDGDTIKLTNGDETTNFMKRGFLAPMATKFVQGKEFPLPKPYTLKKLYVQINKNCSSKDCECYKSRLIEITKIHGAKAALDLLRQLLNNNDMWGSNRHHIAHHIGFYNVITFGASREILALCTEDFENGCIHGFY